MFKKVLIAEDNDSINFAVRSVMEELNIEKVEHAQYCDTAWLLARKAMLENEPFDLLICDLSFKNDHRNEKLKSGKDLIAMLKREDPNLTILVNSVEDHPQTVKTLWDSGDINGYVCKGRNGMKDLKEAIRVVNGGEVYNSLDIEKALKQANTLVLEDFEINLLSYIANGLTQEEIQSKFREKKIFPNSKSTIEKRLKELREEFNARTTPHLIGIVKDLNLI